jgi:hypothetical protein
MVMLTNPRTGLIVLEQLVEKNTSVGTSPHGKQQCRCHCMQLQCVNDELLYLMT